MRASPGGRPCNGSSVLELSDVTVFRGESAVPAVEAVSASAKDGMITALAGENGSGKTSLALTLAGVLPRIVQGRWEGEVRVGGAQLAPGGWPPGVTAVYAASTPGVELLIGSLGDLLRAVQPEISRLAEVLPLGSRDRAIRHLSAGQRQLAAWLFGAARNPRLLVVDEAFASLDAKTARNLVAGFRELPWISSMTTVAVTPRHSGDISHCDAVIALPSKDRAPADRAPEDIPLPRTAPTPTIETEATITAGWAADRGAAFRVTGLRLRRGGVIGVRGAIGTGKTTTLKAIARYPGTRGDSALKRLRKWGRAQYVGGAAYYVAGYATIHDFLAAALGSELSPIVWEIVEPKLRPATLQSDPATLSAGQRHLLAVVTALAATEAPVLCIDEPERGLDAEARRLVIAVAAARLQRGACILVASHDDSFIAALGARGESFVEVQVERP